MGKQLDALMYQTTYTHDYCTKPGPDGEKNIAEEGGPASSREAKADCTLQQINETTVDRWQMPRDSDSPANPGRFQGIYLNTNCPCSPNGAPNKDQLPRAMYNMGDKQDQQSFCNSETRQQQHPPSVATPNDDYYCPPKEQTRPLPPGAFGGQFEQPMMLPESFGAKYRSNHPCECRPEESPVGVSQRNGHEPNHMSIGNAYNQSNVVGNTHNEIKVARSGGSANQNTPCKCPPDNSKLSGPADYGAEWSRLGPMGRTVDPIVIGKDFPQDLKNSLQPAIPAARTAAPPMTAMCPPDQPSTFMRKLFEKYPYMYQVLQETPPEQLISRVFKDRFLSTYQYDYLHMGEGTTEQQPTLDAMPAQQHEEESEETKNIPGCPYNNKTKHGKKLSQLKKGSDDDAMEEEKAKEEEEDLDVSGKKKMKKEKPPITVYMNDISYLGKEIMDQQFYKKALKNEVKDAKKKEQLDSGV